MSTPERQQEKEAPQQPEQTPAVPQLTITTTSEPKYSTDGGSTIMAEEKPSNLTRESTLSTPSTTKNGNPFDTDIEAMIPRTHPPDNCPRKSLSCQRPDTDCQVWPGQEHWRKKAKAAKVDRSRCGCMAKMTKRNRILLQLLIGALIIGIAVGVGFGVSKPLGAGIWKPDN